MASAKHIVRNTFTLKLYRAELHQVCVVLKFDEPIIEEGKACLEIITCASILVDILKLDYFFVSIY